MEVYADVNKTSMFLWVHPIIILYSNSTCTIEKNMNFRALLFT